VHEVLFIRYKIKNEEDAVHEKDQKNGGDEKMGIYCRGKIRGEKGEIEGEFFLNSGSDYVILPQAVAEKLSLKPVGEEDFLLADGSTVRRRVYEIEVELEDHEGKRRRCKSFCTIEKRRDVLGFDVMQKMKVVLNTGEGKAYFL
jgi:predicted aspartyl protease